MTLFKRMCEVQSNNPYFKKDLEKARHANKFIGQGSVRSSTHKYMIAAADMANCGQYEAGDVVFVSAEGARGGRMGVDFAELAKAVEAGACFVTDDSYHRNRPYNIGEREVAGYLENNGYGDTGRGIWKKKP